MKKILWVSLALLGFNLSSFACDCDVSSAKKVAGTSQKKSCGCTTCDKKAS